MTDNHPITPTHEQVAQWGWEAPEVRDAGVTRERYIAAQAAKWGADQELEACCEWFSAERGYHPSVAADLRAGRRPKPPSLKEQALETLLSMQIQPCVINGINTNADLMAKYDILRRALEFLPD